jgi:hypothetical protein
LTSDPIFNEILKERSHAWPSLAAAERSAAKSAKPAATVVNDDAFAPGGLGLSRVSGTVLSRA